MEECVRRIAPESAEAEADITTMMQTGADLRRLADLWLTFYVVRHSHWPA